MRLAARGCSYRQALPFSLAAIFAVLCVPHEARGNDTARIVLLSVPDLIPNADSVRAIVSEDLARVEVAVDVVQRISLPSSDAEWTVLAREQATERVGTLALFGWNCAPLQPCDLCVVEARGGAVTHIPIKPLDGSPADIDGKNALAFALAATAREAVWGGLLLEMSRLVDEGAHPEAPPPAGQRLPEPHQGPVETGGLARAHRPWLWLEGGYHGEYPHPQVRTEHGPFVGLAFSPGKNIVPVLRVGWLGIAQGDGTNGDVRAYAFPIELELRVAFPIGPAMFSLAPVARLDLVVATANPEGPRKESTSFETDFHVGGMTTWHTPLPGGAVEALVGVGVLATIIGNDLDIGNETMIPASKLRIVWSAGLAWSPL